jgi:alpha-L-fucosidase 2
VDVNRIALIGDAAGGSIVSFVGAQNKPDTAVAAVVSFYGVHDWITRTASAKLSDGAAAYLGVSVLDADTSPILRKASAVPFIHRDMPPFLLLHGTDDPQVPYSQSVEFCAKIHKAGGTCELYTVKGGGHGLASWDKVEEFQGYKQHMIAWLKKTLQ